MSTQRPAKEKAPATSAGPTDTPSTGEEDVEGHMMNMPLPVALELARAREREIRQETTRHQFIAEAKNRLRNKH